MSFAENIVSYKNERKRHEAISPKRRDEERKVRIPLKCVAVYKWYAALTEIVIYNEIERKACCPYNIRKKSMYEYGRRR